MGDGSEAYLKSDASRTQELVRVPGVPWFEVGTVHTTFDHTNRASSTTTRPQAVPGVTSLRARAMDLHIARPCQTLEARSQTVKYDVVSPTMQ